jgi:L-cysteine:1D-myo-inositol 2-amino-2-deoxy-alpha-D-glucopyranoside ligase
MIDIISSLLEADLAYEAGGSVYFHVDSWSDYGKLSRLPRPEMLPVANQRGNNPDDPHKQDPLDFVLWQAQAPGEPAWDSPWGPGRPGWHIECSTMCSSLLGNTVDIHGGGSDLIFPHHESEIAQAEGATGQKPFVRFWLHAAMVHHEGEKMSKSLGNLVMARDLLEAWSPDALRLYMAAHHYREPWEHNLQALEKADRLARKLQQAVSAAGGEGVEFKISPTVTAFDEAMDNDLDSPTALVILEKLAEAVEKAAGAGQNVQTAQAAIRSMAQVFGLRLDDGTPEAEVVAGWDEHLKRFV